VRDVCAVWRSGQEGSLDLWRGVRNHIGSDVVRAIREHGYDFDLFDDDAVDVLDPGRFPIVVLPFASDVPEPTLAWLRAAEECGTKVLDVGGALDVGTRVACPSELPEALLAALPQDVAVAPRTGAVGAIHRRIDGVDVYVLANTGADTERVEARFRDGRAVAERWDALTGDVAARGPGLDGVPVTLEAYEAAVFVAYDEDDPSASWEVPAARSVPVPLDEPWTVRLPAESPAVPVVLPHRWEDDKELRTYAGTAVYATSFSLDEVPVAAELDFGAAVPAAAGEAEEVGLRGRSFRAAALPPVGEVAEVVVNGTAVGVVWGTPYRLAIGRHLRVGANTLEVRVSNTAAGALAADPAVAARAEESARLFGRRFRMQDLDLATAGLSSGLLTVPRLLLTEREEMSHRDLDRENDQPGRGPRRSPPAASRGAPRPRTW